MYEMYLDREFYDKLYYTTIKCGGEDMAYHTVENFLKDKNPIMYNFENEFDMPDFDNGQTSIDLFSAYRKLPGNPHADGSNGKCPLATDIYHKLWNYNVDEPGYGNFRKIVFFDTLFGGDTMNSGATIMKIWNKQCDAENEKVNLEKYISVCHTIGNFTLVPAYFNSERGGQDYFDAGLLKLMQTDWHIVNRMAKHVQKKKMTTKKLKIFLSDLASEFPKMGKIPEVKEKDEMTENDWEEVEAYIEKCYREKYKNLYKDFSCKNFIKYINLFFLWDYVDCEKGVRPKAISPRNKSEKEISGFLLKAYNLIRRRSCFMVAMLRIATGTNISKGERECRWREWPVSGVYKEIVDKVFLADKIYPHYQEVIDEIEKVIQDSKDKEFVLEILNQLKKDLDKEES